MSTYCFAWDQNIMGAWGCRATVSACNGHDQSCPFFKSTEEYVEGRKKGMERIASLPYESQQHISEKYYNEEMPWHEKPATERTVDGVSVIDVAGVV